MKKSSYKKLRNTQIEKKYPYRIAAVNEAWSRIDPEELMRRWSRLLAGISGVPREALENTREDS